MWTKHGCVIVLLLVLAFVIGSSYAGIGRIIPQNTYTVWNFIGTTLFVSGLSWLAFAAGREVQKNKDAWRNN